VNLIQIGSAVAAYSAANGGAGRRTWPRLISSGPPTGARLTCPRSPDEPAEGATPAQTAAMLARPGHCSYFYIAPTGATTRPTNVVAFDRAPRHHTDRAFVLFADGSVGSLSPSELRHALAAPTTRAAAP
jgi:prepilin-type processing-associated H-X9-DG protein